MTYILFEVFFCIFTFDLDFIFGAPANNLFLTPATDLLSNFGNTFLQWRLIKEILQTTTKKIIRDGVARQCKLLTLFSLFPLLSLLALLTLTLLAQYAYIYCCMVRELAHDGLHKFYDYEVREDGMRWVDHTP